MNKITVIEKTKIQIKTIKIIISGLGEKPWIEFSASTLNSFSKGFIKTINKQNI